MSPIRRPQIESLHLTPHAQGEMPKEILGDVFQRTQGASILKLLNYEWKRTRFPRSQCRREVVQPPLRVLGWTWNWTSSQLPAPGTRPQDGQALCDARRPAWISW